MKKNPTVKLFIRSNKQIQDLMASKGFNNIRLADAVGVNASYVSSIINGHKNSGRITAFRIARELGVEVDDIFLLKPLTKVIQNNPARRWGNG